MKCLLTFWTHNPESGYKHFGIHQRRISGYYNAAEDIRAFQLLTHIYLSLAHQRYGRLGLALFQFESIQTQTWYLSREFLSHDSLWSLIPSGT